MTRSKAVMASSNSWTSSSLTARLYSNSAAWGVDSGSGVSVGTGDGVGAGVAVGGGWVGAAVGVGTGGGFGRVVRAGYRPGERDSQSQSHRDS